MWIGHHPGDGFMLTSIQGIHDTLLSRTRPRQHIAEPSALDMHAHRTDSPLYQHNLEERDGPDGPTVARSVT
jgi:hypothetical protein